MFHLPLACSVSETSVLRMDGDPSMLRKIVQGSVEVCEEGHTLKKKKVHLSREENPAVFRIDVA